jgi:hypothetical protein
MDMSDDNEHDDEAKPLRRSVSITVATNFCTMTCEEKRAAWETIRSSYCEILAERNAGAARQGDTRAKLKRLTAALRKLGETYVCAWERQGVYDILFSLPLGDEGEEKYIEMFAREYTREYDISARFSLWPEAHRAAMHRAFTVTENYMYRKRCGG